MKDNTVAPRSETNDTDKRIKEEVFGGKFL